MKVASARYTGTMFSRLVRGPSGETYKFRNYPAADEPQWTDLTHVSDAEFFEDMETIEVRWTGTGELVKGIEEPASGVEAMLESWGYRKKQQIAKSLGIKANKTEDELEKAIRPEVEELAETIENQR